MDDSIILKYFEGSLDEKEIAKLRSWVQEREANLDYFLSLKEAYLSMTSKADRKNADTDAEWERFLKKSGSLTKAVTLHRMWHVAAIAAAACCIFFIGRSVGLNKIDPVAFDGTTAIQTGTGEQSRMTLPDGTTVMLNDCSKLTYNPLEWKETRTVKLEGQASFDVVHMENLPFKVESPLYYVSVIGTAFDISCYQEDMFSSVSLKHGKVEIEFPSNSNTAFLNPGETMTYDVATNEYTINNLPDKVTYSWEDKIIIFSGNSLLEKSGELNRRYGYTFEISEKCNNFTYNGEFKEENVHEFMRIIETITPDLKYSIDEKKRNVKIWL